MYSTKEIVDSIHSGHLSFQVRYIPRRLNSRGRDRLYDLGTPHALHLATTFEDKAKSPSDWSFPPRWLVSALNSKVSNVTNSNGKQCLCKLHRPNMVIRSPGLQLHRPILDHRRLGNLVLCRACHCHNIRVPPIPTIHHHLPAYWIRRSYFKHRRDCWSAPGIGETRENLDGEISMLEAHKLDRHADQRVFFRGGLVSCRRGCAFPDGGSAEAMGRSFRVSR